MPKLDAATGEAVENFSKFLEEDAAISKFLAVGLSFREILNCYKKANGINNIEGVQYNAFYRFVNNTNNSNKILRKNEKETVETLGGRKFSGTSDLTIYYNKGCSPVPRIILEMKETGMDGYSLRLIDIFDGYKILTRREMAKKISQKYNCENGKAYPNIDAWLPKLRKINIIVEKVVEDDTAYSISNRLLPISLLKSGKHGKSLRSGLSG